MNRIHDGRPIHTIVIGGGPSWTLSWLSLGKARYLFSDRRRRRAGRRRVAEWLGFAPRIHSHGEPVATGGKRQPRKDQVADYLVDYARKFHLPVRNSVKVGRLYKKDERFVITAGNHRFESDNVVVAMANYQTPRVSAFTRDLDSGIVQLHSHEYRNPSQLQQGGVLIVGAGNSGAEIGLAVARSHPTWISGKESGHIPGRSKASSRDLYLCGSCASWATTC